jgi:TPR repeat protein
MRLVRVTGAGIPGVESGVSMSCIDVDTLTQYEVDAKKGRADALYNLGLAYSTGQGVGVDFIAAHKWFNLAAVRGVEEAKSWRAQISREMDASQISEAQRQAREWLSVFHA